MTFYEFSVSSLLSQEELRSAVAVGTSVEESEVGSHQDLISQLAAPGLFKVGLKIERQEGLYPIFITLILPGAFSPRVMLDVAFTLAQACGATVAVPDLMPGRQGEGGYLLISEDGRFARVQSDALLPIPLLHKSEKQHLVLLFKSLRVAAT